MKSPNALQRTDSQQENGLIMGSMGNGNTPTPHKFNGGLNPLISEFDPASNQKEMRPMVDNYLMTQTQTVELQGTRSLRQFVSPKNTHQQTISAQKSNSKLSQFPQRTVRTPVCQV